MSATRARSLLLFVWALAACGGRSERDTERQPVDPCAEPIVFPDPIVDEAVRDWLDERNQPISRAFARGIGSLYVRGASSLEGLECLTGLRSLAAVEGTVNDLTPIAGLEALESLDFSGNQVTDLTPLTALTNIEYLRFDRNQVEELGPVAGQSGLIQIDFAFNRVSSLEPLRGLRIYNLLAEGNAIEDLSPLSGMRQSLQDLELPANRIVDLSPLAPLSLLQVLDVGENRIEELAPLGSQFGYLSTLSVNDNLLGDLGHLSTLPGLWEVDVSGNQVSSLDGVFLPEPRCEGFFDVRRNPVEATDVADLCATGWVVRYGETQCNADCE